MTAYDCPASVHPLPEGLVSTTEWPDGGWGLTRSRRFDRRDAVQRWREEVDPEHLQRDLAVAALLIGAACNTAASPSAGASGAAARAAQFCQGTKIVFFPGGTPGGGFETVVYNGAKAAEAAFGPTVTYQWSDWDPNKMITQFQEAVATKPNGIVVMGHPGDDAFDPLIDDARSQGIIVTVMNTELQKAEAKYATAGTGYVGAVLHDAGAALADEAVARGGLKSGDRALVWGLVAQAGRGERTQGILDAL